MPSAPSTAIVLARQLVSLLTPNARADLALVLNAPCGLSLGALPDATLHELTHTLGALLEITPGDSRIAVASTGLAKSLAEALRTWSHTDSAVDAASRIREAIGAQDIEAALRIFNTEGGVFFAHVHGLDVSSRVLNAFPESVRRANEVLRLAEAINAMKLGHIAHAKGLLVEVDPAARTLASVCQSAASISLDLICCRMVIGVCDEEPVTPVILALLFRVLEQSPIDASMRRGMLYNVALDAFVRQGQWEAAHEAALQARYHFTNARAPLAGFYIELYRALIDLSRGNISGARSILDRTSGVLQHDAALSTNDRRLLDALRGVCAYECGDADPLASLIVLQMQEGAFAEIWPSIAGPLIAYGMRALVRSNRVAAAGSYLERWRLQQWRSERFAAEIALTEVELWQLTERWHAADDALERLSSEWQLGPAPLPTDAAAGAGIEFHLRRCRAVVEVSAADASVQVTLDSLLAGNRLTARQRIAVLVWAAVAAAARRDWPRACSLVVELASRIESTGIVAVLGEQRTVLKRLLESREARKRLSVSAKVAASCGTTQGSSIPTFTRQRVAD